MSDTISNIKVFPVTGNKTIRGNVYFTVGNTVTVKGTVMDGKNGLFVSLPGRTYTDKTTGEQKWADDVKFITKEVGNAVQKTLLAAYNAQVSGGNVTPSKTTTTTTKNSDIPF
jgi:DNA-binding cell septation regulator SpoVG